MAGSTCVCLSWFFEWVFPSFSKLFFWVRSHEVSCWHCTFTLVQGVAINPFSTPGMDFPTLTAGLWLAQTASVFVPACWAMRGLIALTCFWSTKRREPARQRVSPCLCPCCPRRSSGPALPPKQSRYVAACWSTRPRPAWLPWRPARTLSSMNYGTQTSSYQTGEINLHSSISPLKVAWERWRSPSVRGSGGKKSLSGAKFK